MDKALEKCHAKELGESAEAARPGNAAVARRLCTETFRHENTRRVAGAAAVVGVFSLALGVVVFFYVTLQAMEAPPADLMAADVEPSMQSVLNDLYGSGT